MNRLFRAIVLCLSLMAGNKPKGNHFRPFRLLVHSKAICKRPAIGTCTKVEQEITNQGSNSFSPLVWKFLE